MRSGNPALNEKTFKRFDASTGTMTIRGTANKTMILLGLVIMSAAWMWSRFGAAMAAEQSVGSLMPWLLGGSIGGFIVSLVTIFKPVWSPYTTPIYALLEGLVLGGISALTEAAYPGIVFQAVILTFGTMFSLLLAYQSGWIKATENFRLGIVAATGGIMLIYLVSFGLRLFGLNMPYIHDSGWIGIGFSLFVVVIAALNLVLDFDFIEQGAQRGAPAYMEWYGAFGLLVTLVWLYLEILRLLSKLRSRD